MEGDGTKIEQEIAKIFYEISISNTRILRKEWIQEIQSILQKSETLQKLISKGDIEDTCHKLIYKNISNS